MFRVLHTYLLLLSIIILTSVKLYSQANNIRFEHLSIEQGHTQTTVSCIVQDIRGFMWFGTYDGLIKFDGYSFTVYKPNPQDLQSLSDNGVNSIYEDQSGVLWIGTFRGGLNKFNRELSENGSRYLLALRLIPVFPFFLINICAGTAMPRN